VPRKAWSQAFPESTSMNTLQGARLRIYIIDDHPVVREGLGRAIQDLHDMEVVGEAATAAEAMTGSSALKPDVILVDLHLPDRDGPELITALRTSVPLSKLVVISGYDDEYRVAEALRA